MWFLVLNSCIVLTLANLVDPTRSRLEDFGLQEAAKEAQILGRELDCSNLDQCEDTSGRKGFICATNGITYKSLCSYMKAYCTESDVVFKHHGECTASEKCLGSRRVALKISRTKQEIFIPTCNEDGTFAPIQCRNFDHKDLKFCWCMTPTGVNIPRSDVKNGIPNCEKFIGPQTSNEYSTKRNPYKGTAALNRHLVADVIMVDGSLFAPDQTHNGDPVETKIRKKKIKGFRGCAGAKRKAFNSNIVKMMIKQYQRSGNVTEFSSSQQQQIAVLKWNFDKLDKQKPDRKLRRKEYKSIQNIVRRNILPKKCAKKFPKMCDDNSDKKISLSEWLNCFGTNNEELKNRPTNGRSPKSSETGRPITKPKQDCLTDRRLGLETLNSGNENIYIPQCEKNGRFKPIQCYGLTKKMWCFCVNIITGEMIKNTSVQNDQPKCPLVPKPWPSCAEPDKEKKFLRSLLNYFAILAKSNTTGKKNDNVLKEVVDKQVLENIFNQLDMNHNGFLESKEKKKLKYTFKKQKSLWKCGKKIHKVCDLDYDKKISLKEFFVCLLPKKTNSVAQPPIWHQGLGTKNQWDTINPFEILIKSE